MSALSPIQRDCSAPEPTLVEGGMPIFGWRYWVPTHTTPEGRDGRCPAGCAYKLKSLNKPHHWKPGINQAKCRVYHFPHEAPVPPCTCGLYAYRGSQKYPISGIKIGGFIYGTVALSGRVLIGTRGFRAQYAEIIELHGAAPFWRLGEIYGVPYTAHSKEEVSDEYRRDHRLCRDPAPESRRSGADRDRDD